MWLSATPSSRVVGFYHHQPSWSCSFWLRNCLQLRPVGCLVGPTHARGRTLDLRMTDVSDLVRVAVVAPIGNSDHFSLTAVISMAQAVQNCVLVGKCSSNIKSTGKQYVVKYRISPSITFGLLRILLRFWTNSCNCWLDVMFQPRSSVCLTRISLGLMINAGMLLASCRRIVFGGPRLLTG